MSGELAGRTVGGYEILDLLGAGGMGEVYRARQVGLDRTVALKVLPAGAGDGDLQLRFRREGAIHVRLAHPGLVRVFDVGGDGSLSWIAMELVRGTTLAQVIDTRAPLPLDFVLAAAQSLAGSLVYLHDHGVAHRDFKPQNVLVAGTGEMKLADFGVARQASDTTMTQAGSLMGTVSYMAPEAVDGAHEVGPAGDVHGLGLIIHEMVTGRLPYGGPDLVSWLEAIRTVRPARMAARRAEVPAALDELVLAMLEKEPAARPEPRTVLARLEGMAPGGRANATLELRVRELAPAVPGGAVAAKGAWRTQVLAPGAHHLPRRMVAPMAQATAVLRPPPEPVRVPVVPVAVVRAEPLEHKPSRARTPVVVAVGLAAGLLAAIAVLVLARELRSGAGWDFRLALAVVRAVPLVARFERVESALLEGIGGADEARMLASFEAALAAGVEPRDCADAFASIEIAPSPQARDKLDQLLGGPTGRAVRDRWIEVALREQRFPPRTLWLLGEPRPDEPRVMELARLVTSPDPRTREYSVNWLQRFPTRTTTLFPMYAEVLKGALPCGVRNDAFTGVWIGTPGPWKTGLYFELLGDRCPEIAARARENVLTDFRPARDERETLAAFARCSREVVPVWRSVLDEIKPRDHRPWIDVVRNLCQLRTGRAGQKGRVLRELMSDRELVAEMRRVPELGDAISATLIEVAARDLQRATPEAGWFTDADPAELMLRPATLLDVWRSVGCRAPAGFQLRKSIDDSDSIELSGYLPLDGVLADAKPDDAAGVLGAVFARGSDEVRQFAMARVMEGPLRDAMRAEPERFRGAIERLLALEPPPKVEAGSERGSLVAGRPLFEALVRARVIDAATAARGLLQPGAGPERVLAAAQLDAFESVWPVLAQFMRVRGKDEMFVQALANKSGEPWTEAAHRLVGAMAESRDGALSALARRLDPGLKGVAAGRLWFVSTLPPEQRAARYRTVLVEMAEEVSLGDLQSIVLRDARADVRAIGMRWTRALDCGVVRDLMRSMVSDAAPEVRLEVALHARECGFDTLLGLLANDVDPRVREAAQAKR